jgi:hypothetical protein
MAAAALSAGACRLTPGASHDNTKTIESSKDVFWMPSRSKEILFNGAGIVTRSATHA